MDLKGQKVILDSDLAELYGVQTRDINKAVKNNPDKFPVSYIYELNKDELEYLRCKFSTAKFTKTRVKPKVFTEKGLYMLATILKSQAATQTTIAIIETFSKLRQLTKNIKELSVNKDKETQKSLMQKSGGLITEIFDEGLSVFGSETTIELNFAVMKLKHTIKKGKR
ncbi:MAG: DNA-binding protein [Elusimicrobia bacterium HGW-Elusimicrobia-2]|nr:MAG: DNA-binding protein [Elusimicrobia bacterium HGW-Elusimicrobia-2]